MEWCKKVTKEAANGLKGQVFSYNDNGLISKRKSNLFIGLMHVNIHKALREGERDIITFISSVKVSVKQGLVRGWCCGVRFGFSCLQSPTFTEYTNKSINKNNLQFMQTFSLERLDDFLLGR